MPFDIREAEIAACVAVRELLVVEAEQVEDRRVEIVDMDLVLLREVAVVVGRAIGDGRDHNPNGFTMWMAGGGVKRGMAYGATDDYGYFAQEDKVHIHDLHATILYLLGLDHEKLTHRYAGRDFRLTDVEGHVVKDIIA